MLLLLELLFVPIVLLGMLPNKVLHLVNYVKLVLSPWDNKLNAKFVFLDLTNLYLAKPNAYCVLLDLQSI